jgi:16S rRNA A1518/A1519 N6-dimethyltransferase RsmA/KsgA/DIM1 with predicted DNA glycosylase/AP lyase activity
MIDLGAGDGKVTNQIRKFHSQVFATEASSSMRKILTSETNGGIKILPIGIEP